MCFGVFIRSLGFFSSGFSASSTFSGSSVRPSLLLLMGIGAEDISAVHDLPLALVKDSLAGEVATGAMSVARLVFRENRGDVDLRFKLSDFLSTVSCSPS